MARQLIDIGAHIDFLTPEENQRHITEAFKNVWSERARGIKPLRFVATGTVSGSAVTIPAQTANSGQTAQIMGPQDGFSWTVQRISINGLGTADTVSVYRSQGVNTTTTANNFLFNLTGTSPYIKTGSKSLILFGDESLVVTGSSLTATGQITVNGEAIEVPSEMISKIL